MALPNRANRRSKLTNNEVSVLVESLREQINTVYSLLSHYHDAIKLHDEKLGIDHDVLIKEKQEADKASEAVNDTSAQ